MTILYLVCYLFAHFRAAKLAFTMLCELYASTSCLKSQTLSAHVVLMNHTQNGPIYKLFVTVSVDSSIVYSALHTHRKHTIQPVSTSIELNLKLEVDCKLLCYWLYVWLYSTSYCNLSNVKSIFNCFRWCYMVDFF